jgi:hypothetical protein
MPEIPGYRESHKALVGRTRLPGGQDAELLAGKKPPDDRLGVQSVSFFHRTIFVEYPPFVNTWPG